MTTPEAPPICLHCGGSGAEQDFDEEEQRPPELSDAEYRRWLRQRDYRPKIMDCVDKFLRFGRMGRLCEPQGSGEIAEDISSMMENVDLILEAKKQARRKREKSELAEAAHAQLFVICAEIVWFLSSRCYPASHEDVLDVMADAEWTRNEDSDTDSTDSSG